MRWSKYNLLFKSEKHGHMLYNSLSNSFASLDDASYKELQQIRESPESCDFAKNPLLYVQLLGASALVDEREEEALLNVVKLRHALANFGDKTLGLTIVPTLACNFACTYCYEAGMGQPAPMTEETEEKIVQFIQRRGHIRFLFINWYGGEPLLKFDAICRMTEKVKRTETPFSANLVTNGYLLTKETISRLDDLNIKRVQVTIDGPEETHDRRRILKNGGKTYQTIVANIENLLERWSGKLTLRINVDKSNKADFSTIYHFLDEKFKGKNTHIAAGFVSGSPAANPDIGCEFADDEAFDFMLDERDTLGLENRRYYPKHVFSCAASNANGFVIGPQGEIYKCWRDVGLKEKVAGHVGEGGHWNMKLLAEYMIEGSAFDNPSCRGCFYAPVCDRECAHSRLKKSRLNRRCDVSLDTFVRRLEAHYETKIKSEETRK